MLQHKKLHVKIGDLVTVISGFHKKKTGEIIKINKKTGKVILKGVNFKFKHIKPKNENEIVKIKYKRITLVYAKSIFIRRNC